MKKLIIIFCLLLSAIAAFCQHSYKTYTYYKSDSKSLELDLFLPTEKCDSAIPIVIFLHGGGFSSGNKSNGHVFCSYLAEKGIAAASISYTLYMKNKSFGCDGQVPEKIKAIQYASNDLWLATNYLIENSKDFNIDTSSIFIAGQSAGAEAVLHAASWNYQAMKMYPELPDKRPLYRGVISGAGAIMDLNLIDSTNALPLFLFHGTHDRLVPYATAAHHFCPVNSSGWLMFFGSFSLFKHYNDLNVTCQLVSFCSAGHELSGTLFINNSEWIYKFITRVLKKEYFFEHNKLNTSNNQNMFEEIDVCP